MGYYWVTAFISAAFLISSGYSNDFKTFRIIPSEAVQTSYKFLSNLNEDSEDSFYDSKNTESSDAMAEHRTINMPINIMRNNQDSVKNVNHYQHKDNKQEMKLSVPYPYAYHSELPKTLQIAVEPHQNDTKFKITDTFLDSFFKPQAQTKASTTKKTKKPNKNQANKLTRPNNNSNGRPNKNVKQGEGTEEPTEGQDNTTYKPRPTHGSVIQNNELNGSSQIGNRDSQMILKPTVIVNIRGTVSNSEGGLAVESKSGDIEVSSDPQDKSPARNVFHISQEINIQRKPSDDIADTYIEQEEPTAAERKISAEERTFNMGADEHWLKERMSIFDDYSDFSLYR